MKSCRREFSLLLILVCSFTCLSAKTKDPRAWYALGMKALKERNYYTAIDNFLEALELNPFYMDSYRAIMEAYIALDQDSKAMYYAQQCLAYSEGDLPFYVMYADLLVKQGDYSQAKQYFEKVLSIEENNKGALLGMARLYRAQNNLILAGRYYSLLFTLYPGSTSLPVGEVITLLAQQGKNEEAIHFIIRMRGVCQNSPEFSQVVSQFYVQQGDYEEARVYAQHCLDLSQALGFKELEVKAYQQLALISLRQQKSDEAVTYLKQALLLVREDATLNYLLGLAYLKEGELSLAQDCFYCSVALSKGEEVYHEALETTFFMPESPFKDLYRSFIAGEYSKKAKDYARMYLYEKALNYALKAREIEPENNEIRLLVATLYRNLGFHTLSFRELLILKNERKYVSEDLDNLLEACQMTFLRSSLFLWGYQDLSALNRLLAERNRVQIALFYSQYDKSLQGSNMFFLSALQRSLEKNFFIKVANFSSLKGQLIPYQVSSCSQAFRLARENNLDVYIMVYPSGESSQGFSLTADIYLAKTAAKVKTIRVARINEHSRATAIEQLTQEIADFLPVKGSFIAREGERALINLGKVDKVNERTQFAILRGSDLRWCEGKGNYCYDSQKVLGIARVKKLDDFVSEVTIEKKGLVDIIDVNHSLVPLP